MYGLTEEMSEVSVLSTVSRKQPCLDLIFPTVSNFQLVPNLMNQILCLDPIKLRFAKGTNRVVDSLVVGVVHIP
jgi:hypothetical protein